MRTTASPCAMSMPAVAASWWPKLRERLTRTIPECAASPRVSRRACRRCCRRLPGRSRASSAKATGRPLRYGRSTQPRCPPRCRGARRCSKPARLVPSQTHDFDAGAFRASYAWRESRSRQRNRLADETLPAFDPAAFLSAALLAATSACSATQAPSAAGTATSPAAAVEETALTPSPAPAPTATATVAAPSPTASPTGAAAPASTATPRPAASRARPPSRPRALRPTRRPRSLPSTLRPGHGLSGGDVASPERSSPVRTSQRTSANRRANSVSIKKSASAVSQSPLTAAALPRLLRGNLYHSRHRPRNTRGDTAFRAIPLTITIARR